MDDSRVREFEERLWLDGAEQYCELIEVECLMVLPEPPSVMGGKQAIDAESDTPRWARVTFSRQHIKRLQDGLIVVACKAEAYEEAGKAYPAFCTSTYRRLDHDSWRVVQHQQTLPPLSNA